MEKSFYDAYECNAVCAAATSPINLRLLIQGIACNKQGRRSWIFKNLQDHNASGTTAVIAFCLVKPNALGVIDRDVPSAAHGKGVR